MKENLKKVWPIILPILCIIAGIISIVFFCVGPWGKGQYDILAIGVVLIALAIISYIIDIVVSKEKKK